MKKIFTKENIMPVAVLTVICLVIAALLAGINSFTSPVIAEREEQKVYDSLREVLDGDFAPAELPEGTDKSVTAIYKVTKDGADVGKVVTVSAKGYASTILLTVGVDVEGKVTKAVVTSQAETHGKAGMDSYTDRFAGVAKDDLAGVETFSGATVSSTAIKNAIITAVNAAMGVATEKEPEPLPRTDEELLASAATLLGTEATELTNVTPESTEGAVKRVYKTSDGKDYAVYVLTISQYGTPDNEAIVHISRSGKIEALTKLLFKTSDAIYGYVPPTEEQINAFYDRLVGATADTLEGIEATTNATNTSNSLKAALTEAITAVKDLAAKDMPTEEGEVMNAAAALLGVTVDKLINVTPEDSELVKRVYKTAAGTDYAVYAVTISQYGTPDNEAVVHISRSGEIKALTKLLFKTSDAIYGYVPPTEDQINAFYDRLVGATADTLEGIEATTNATNTSNSLKAALTEAITAVKDLAAKDMPTEEASVKALAAEMLGVTADALEVIIPEGSDYARRVFLAGDELAVYTVVISKNYGTVETETLVHIGSDGAIKAIKRMTWKTSDPIYGYVPPTEEQVKAFYDRLIGAKASTLEGIEAATNATNTSNNLKAALAEAMELSEDLIEEKPDYLPRIIGIVIISLAAVISVGATIFFKRRRRA